MRHINPFDLVKRERKAHRYIISEWRFSKRGEFFFLKMKNKHWLEGMLKKIHIYIYYHKTSDKKTISFEKNGCSKKP